MNDISPNYYKYDEPRNVSPRPARSLTPAEEIILEGVRVQPGKPLIEVVRDERFSLRDAVAALRYLSDEGIIKFNSPFPLAGLEGCVHAGWTRQALVAHLSRSEARLEPRTPGASVAPSSFLQYIPS